MVLKYVEFPMLPFCSHVNDQIETHKTGMLPCQFISESKSQWQWKTFLFWLHCYRASSAATLCLWRGSRFLHREYFKSWWRYWRWRRGRIGLKYWFLPFGPALWPGPSFLHLMQSTHHNLLYLLPLLVLIQACLPVQQVCLLEDVGDCISVVERAGTRSTAPSTIGAAGGLCSSTSSQGSLLFIIRG